MTKTYRIKNRFRFTIFVALMIVLTVFLINAFMGLDQASSMEVVNYTTVEVCYGDTLWNIAQYYMPEDMDLRTAVHIISSLNDVTADELVPGMQLLVPIYS